MEFSYLRKESLAKQRCNVTGVCTYIKLHETEAGERYLPTHTDLEMKIEEVKYDGRWVVSGRTSNSVYKRYVRILSTCLRKTNTSLQHGHKCVGMLKHVCVCVCVPEFDCIDVTICLKSYSILSNLNSLTALL